MYFQLLVQLCEMGSDPQLIAFHPYDKSKPSNKQNQIEERPMISNAVDDPMSDEDIEEEFGAVVNRKIGESLDKSEDQLIIK